MRLTCFAAAFVIGFSCVAAAEEPRPADLVAACDNAAASPFDKDRPAGIAGVTIEKMSASGAIQACDAAVKAVPDDHRMVMQLGRAYLAARNYDAARMQFDKANRMGNVLAATELAGFYTKGLGGLPADDTEALRLLKKAADSGSSIAQTSLGYFHQFGRGGLDKNENEAARLYKLAADRGEAYGQSLLASFYESGRGGLPKLDTEAARLHRLAADQGNLASQDALGVFYETGRGDLPKNDQEALRFYKMGANQGFAASQYHLGRFYEGGLGGRSQHQPH